MVWWSRTEEAPKPKSRSGKSHGKETSKRLPRKKSRKPEIVEEKRGGYREVDERTWMQSKNEASAARQYQNHTLNNQKGTENQSHQHSGKYKVLRSQPLGGVFQDNKSNHRGKDRVSSVTRGRTGYKERPMPPPTKTSQYENNNSQRHEDSNQSKPSYASHPSKVQESRPPYVFSQPQKAATFANTPRPDPSAQFRASAPFRSTIITEPSAPISHSGGYIPTADMYNKLFKSPKNTTSHHQTQKQTQHNIPQTHRSGPYSTTTFEPRITIPLPSSNKGAGVPPKTPLYTVLGVPKDASTEAIRKAYRKLVVTMHLDRNLGDPQATDKFQEAVIAYENLTDMKAREYYDRTGTVLPTRLGA